MYRWNYDPSRETLTRWGGGACDTCIGPFQFATGTLIVLDRALCAEFIQKRMGERYLAPLDAWYIVEFKRPGIQNGVYRKLRLGHYQLDARLDLHRFGIKQAREEVFSFISEASHLGLRTLLIVHGKGHSNANGEKTAVLKGFVNQWLRELEAVQAFHSAQPQHGGTGSVYVLLRKSAEQKRENRLKYLKGRVQD